MEIFSTLGYLAVTYGQTLMMAGDLNILYFPVLAMLLIFLTARLTKKQRRGALKPSKTETAPTDHSVSKRLFSSHRIQAEKKCPNCAEQLPLSALICEDCDYNFLSRSVGSKQKFLTSREPIIHLETKQRFMSAGL